MTSILVVCTGNICRSPIAEGIPARRPRTPASARARRLCRPPARAGWEGSGAMPESVQAAARARRRHRRPRRAPARDRHAARRRPPGRAWRTEHREQVAASSPEVGGAHVHAEGARAAAGVAARRRAAPRRRACRARRSGGRRCRRRAGSPGNPHDDDVADPLGLPLESYRAIAWELDEWTDRLVDGLVRRRPPMPVPPRARARERARSRSAATTRGSPSRRT